MQHGVVLTQATARPPWREGSCAGGRVALVSSSHQSSNGTSRCRHYLRFLAGQRWQWTICSSAEYADQESAGDEINEDSDNVDDEDFELPNTAREAIEVGLKNYEEGRFDAALDLFRAALDLPGSGVKRFRNKPPEISNGEKIAALYNIACCYSSMQDTRPGLVALSGCLEAGYKDFNQLRTDPDLDFIRKDPRFEVLMNRFDKGGFFGSLTKGLG